jgi:rubrerythrin
VSQTELFSVKKILEGCIERENFSARLYKRAIDVVEDPEGKSLLDRMRIDELRHAKQLDHALETGTTDQMGKGDPAAFGAPLSKGPVPELDEKSTPVQIITFGIFHEEKAIEYYSRYVDVFRGTELGDLFEQLRKEELFHREKLAKFLKAYE